MVNCGRSNFNPIHWVVSPESVKNVFAPKYWEAAQANLHLKSSALTPWLSGAHPSGLRVQVYRA